MRGRGFGRTEGRGRERVSKREMPELMEHESDSASSSLSSKPKREVTFRFYIVTCEAGKNETISNPVELADLLPLELSATAVSALPTKCSWERCGKNQTNRDRCIAKVSSAARIPVKPCIEGDAVHQKKKQLN